MKHIILTDNVKEMEKLPLLLKNIKTDYDNHKSRERFLKELDKCAKSYKNIMFSFDFFIIVGEELIESLDRSSGFDYFLTIEKYLNQCEDCISDTVTLYLRLAEFYLENNETEKGVGYLIRLCSETTSNYEESIQFRDLTDVWEKYRHLVAGKVPESVVKNGGVTHIPPEKCSMKIKEILSLPKDELLTKLSEHLNEMSGNGTYLNYLNKWEKIVFDADLVCTEVNSSGFSGYLYYHGNRFFNAVKAFEITGSEKMVKLMASVQNKFPSKRIPKSIESIQNKLDKMEETGIDFEENDEHFYEFQEDLLDKLYEFIMSNQKRFR